MSLLSSQLQSPSSKASKSPPYQSPSLFPNYELYRYPANSSPYTKPGFDRRVVKGNAISHFTDYDEATTQATRRKIARAREVKQLTFLEAKSKAFRYRLLIPGTPCVEPERVREPTTLEAIEEPPVTYKGLQSDWFPEKLVEPIFIPEHIWVDEETQIEDGDLFDFDLEVEPYLEVLVGKACQNAMFETVYEDELYLYSADRACYKAKRAAEKVELQRLVEQERRDRDEKERRREQFLEACRLQKEVEARVAEVAHVKHDLGELLPNILEGFRSAGYLLEDIKEALERGVTPWLWNQLDRSAAVKEVSRDILTEMVRDITETRAVIHEILGEMEDEVAKGQVANDTSDDEEDGVLGEGQEWNVVEYSPPERKGSLASLDEIPEHEVIISRIRAMSMMPDVGASVRVSIDEERVPDISWMRIIKKKDVWSKLRDHLGSSNML